MQSPTVDLKKIQAKYQGEVDRLNLKFYTKKINQDLKLVDWYLNLLNSGDIDKIIIPNKHRLYDFLDNFQSTCLVYALNDKNKIDYAFWLSPTDDYFKAPAFAGLWMSSKIKGTKRSLELTFLIYNLAFELFPAILGTTWQPDVLEIHRKLGYNIVGTLNGLYGKTEVYQVKLTKEDFKESKFYKVASRRI